MKKTNLFALFVVPTFLTLAALAKKPNVIVIMADDLGYGDIGCYGAKPKNLKTKKVASTGRCARLAGVLSAGCLQAELGGGEGGLFWVRPSSKEPQNLALSTSSCFPLSPRPCCPQAGHRQTRSG